MGLIRDGGARDRGGETRACIRCLREWDPEDLDRIQWCEECRESAQETARRWGWLAGAVGAAALALWILVVIRPSELIVGGWVAVVAAAFYLSARIVREIAYGVMRVRNRRAVEAVPPVERPG